MTTLRVSEALQSVANSCRTLATELNAGTPPASGTPSQPSAAAMRAAHASVSAAADTMSARMDATGTHIAFVDISFVNNEAQSALKLSAITTDP